MSALTAEEKELLERLRKKGDPLRTPPAEGDGAPAGDKFGGFGVGVDERGKPFPPPPSPPPGKQE
jgi:hypothetical protein